LQSDYGSSPKTSMLLSVGSHGGEDQPTTTSLGGVAGSPSPVLSLHKRLQKTNSEDFKSRIRGDRLTPSGGSSGSGLIGQYLSSSQFGASTNLHLH